MESGAWHDTTGRTQHIAVGVIALMVILTLLGSCTVAFAKGPLRVDAGPNKIIAAGRSCVLEATVSGGKPPYLISWSPVSTLDNPALVRPTASPTVTTTYLLRARDRRMKQRTDMATVTVLPRLTANAGADQTIHYGEVAVLTGTASGGTPPYTYCWSPAEGLSDPYAAQPAASPDTTTTYTLTVTDSAAQTASAATTVSVQRDLYVADVGANRGQIVTPVIYIDHAAGMAQVEIEISFDALSKTLLNVRADNDLPPHWILNFAETSPGIMLINAYSPTATEMPAGAADLFVLTLREKASAPAGTTLLSLHDVTLLDAAGSAIGPVVTHDGTNTVTVDHALTVTVQCDPATVASGATTNCAAAAVDDHGHSIVAWSWDDGGAGGTFSPSASVQNPTYTAPWNLAQSNLAVTLTAIATCAGPQPLSGAGATTLIVQPAPVIFADVPWDFLARRYVEAIYRAGITSGYYENPLRFCPDYPVTRGQIAVFITRAAGMTWLNRPTARFSDVPRGANGVWDGGGDGEFDADGTHWAYGFIERPADPTSWGGTSPTIGFDDGTYRARENITRAQAVTMLDRGQGRTWYDPGTASFADVARGSDGRYSTQPYLNGHDADGTYWAYGWIERPADPASWGRYGPPPADRGGAFRPDDDCNRAEMAVLLCRALEIPN